MSIEQGSPTSVDIPRAPERPDGGIFGNLFVTDHPDNPAESKDKLVELYSGLRDTRIKSVRYDWRWNKIQPGNVRWNEPQLKHYQTAREAMNEAGLDAPTIILSSPPEWAVEMYKRGDKEGFNAAYRAYVTAVKDTLDKGGGKPIERVQVLNELNNKVYNPIATEDIPELCDITRDVFGADVKLVATVLATNLHDNKAGRQIGQPIGDYLDQHGEVLRNNFDVIGVDYYPATWHLPIGEAVKETWTRRREQMPETNKFFRSMAGNMTLLRSVYDKISEWGVDYELGEVGRPSKAILGGEKYQALFFEAFFDGYEEMHADMERNGKKLPSGVDLYMLRDEPARTALRHVPGLREQKWGLFTSAGEPKDSVALFQRDSQ